MPSQVDNVLPRMPAFAERLLLFCYILIALGPFFVLVIAGMESGSLSHKAVLLATSRRLELFFNTLVLSAAVAIFSLILGAGIGSILWLKPRLAALIVPAFLIVLPMPGYIHVSGWSLLAYRIGLSWHNPLAAWWTMVMWLMPLSSLAVYIGLRAIDRELLEVASLAAGGEKVWFSVALPLLVPVMAAAGGFNFVLALLDYTIPSLCQVNVYAFDIFADFSLHADPGRAFVLSLPILILSAAVIALSILPLQHVSSFLIPQNSNDYFPLNWKAGYRGIGMLFVIIALVQPTLPLLSLGLEALSGPEFNILKGSISSLIYSCAISIAAAFVCIVLGYVVARRLAFHSRQRYCWWLVVLLPWALPSPLVGIAWIEIGSWLYPLHGSNLLIILGEVTRFAPLAVLLSWAFLKRVDHDLLAAALIHAKREYQAFLKVELPLVKMAFLGATAFILAFVIGELGTAVMLTPPGQETITVRIYNYLHYGARGAVALLCLSMGLVTVVAGVLARSMFMNGERG